MIISLYALNDLLAMHDLELMDFGTGLVTMPIAKDGSYSTSSLIFVMKKVSGKTFLAMGIEIPYSARHGQGGAFEFHDKIAEKIAKRFTMAAKVAEAGDKLPDKWESLHSITFDEPVAHPMSNREAIVRQAIIDLGKVGLRISGFKCHAETLMHMVNERTLCAEIIRGTEAPDFGHPPKTTYCGIPVEQDANEPTPIS